MTAMAALPTVLEREDVTRAMFGTAITTRAISERSAHGSRERLRGRGRKCSTIDRLVEAVRAAGSGVLIVRGEPGRGKTALSEDAITAAPDLRVVRTVGVESEMGLPFARLRWNPRMEPCGAARVVA